MPLLCMLDDHHTHHLRILRSFRSHKTLRNEAAHPQEMPHFRKNSDASSMARSSTDSSRPSTSRTDMSIDLDPLRCHPPLATAPTPAVHHFDSRRYEPHELRQARSSHNHSQTKLHSQPEPSMVIYDGFDFGFGHQKPAGGQREPAQTDCWQSSFSDSGSEAASPGSHASEWDDPVVTPRPNPAARQGADYFMKRGDWKRRGIIFTAEVPMASEDECFDLDMH
ncbi:hypothetical protein B0H63DRAFT_285933 [Podospora didyma]|uniref:Uncharacterized protein n=1 Tax=Podospora didyma TaxID=330526 RepID=A0AAE0K8E6_9PEZI|nr:hypothetical protein B0H63DRAFT_285933 [Podospora didyma]